MSNWINKWQGRVRTEEDLVSFVDDVGFCTINTLDKYPLFPSQEAAMGLDDVLGRTWFWKDDLHNQKRIYYSRIFGKPGFISFGCLPLFIATNGEVADELIMYGKLPVTAQEIYRIIEERGPIPIKLLKGFLGPEAQKASANALIELEKKFMITKVGLTGREMGTYGYIWDLAERWTPEAFSEADRIGRSAAQQQIKERLVELGVEPDAKFLSKVLRWTV